MVACGSVGGWPIGIRESQIYPAIALTEGAPDMLAAFHGVWLTGREAMIAPVTILGAGMSIAAAALSYFAGKKVRIFVHGEECGQAGRITLGQGAYRRRCADFGFLL